MYSNKLFWLFMQTRMVRWSLSLICREHKALLPFGTKHSRTIRLTSVVDFELCFFSNHLFLIFGKGRWYTRNHLHMDETTIYKSRGGVYWWFNPRMSENKTSKHWSVPAFSRKLSFYGNEKYRLASLAAQAVRHLFFVKTSRDQSHSNFNGKELGCVEYAPEQEDRRGVDFIFKVFTFWKYWSDKIPQ